MKLTLKALRVNAGFTIEKASKELGISTVTLRSYETNKTIPTVKMMNKMLNLYNAKFSNIDDVTESNELIVKLSSRQTLTSKYQRKYKERIFYYG